jgi:hypothetical protein
MVCEPLLVFVPSILVRPLEVACTFANRGRNGYLLKEKKATVKRLSLSSGMLALESK